MIGLCVIASTVLLSCGSDVRSYMDDALAPCVPIEGALNEPCERRVPWQIDTYPWVYATYSRNVIKSLPLDPVDEFRREWRNGSSSSPQVILRGIVYPGSTRCTDVHARLYDDGTHRIFTPESKTALVVCYVDVAAREYIVNRGPARLEVVVGWVPGVSTDDEGFGTREYFKTFEGRIGESMEGIEFVFDLVSPFNLVHGAWHYDNLWDVQRREDGTIVGLSWWIDVFGDGENTSDFEYPLQELQRKLRDAHATVSAEYGGRIAAGEDSPKIVADAHRDSLLAQLRELGAYDVPGITPIVPPPSLLLPLPPTGLLVTQWTNPIPEVDLEWYAPVSSTVTHYKIVRIDSLGNEKVIAEALPGEFTETTDRDLPVAGVEYTYTVIAVNDHGESPPSAGETVRNGPPNPPTDLYVSLQPGNEADLEWYAPASSHVTGYRVERKQGNGAWVTLQDNIPSEHLETTDFGLVSGQAYTYRVIALGEWADSAPSTPYILHVP